MRLSGGESYLRLENPAAAATARLLGGTLRCGGRAAWIADGAACFASLLADLRAAKAGVRLAAPRVRPGVVWDTVFTALRQCAARGAEVSLGLPGLRADELRRMHIRPVPPAWCTQAEIDGRIVYAGLPVLCDAFAGLRSEAPPRLLACLRWEAGADYGYAMDVRPRRLPAAALNMTVRAERSVTLMAPRLSPALRAGLRLAADAGVQVRVIRGGRGLACCADGCQALSGGLWVCGGRMELMKNGGMQIGEGSMPAGDRGAFTRYGAV